MSQRWYRAVAGLVAVAVVLPAMGCTKAGDKAPPGSIVALATASATPAAEPVPVVGQCYAQSIRGYLDSLPPLADCAAAHESEIAYVGSLAPTAASAAPTDPADQGVAAADATCRTKTAEYVGMPLGRRGVTFEIGLPATPSWSTGARWFACEVVIVDGSPGRAAIQSTAGSHAAGRVVPPPRCFVLTGPHTTVGMTDVPCDQPHHAEYLGVTRAEFGRLPANDASMAPFVTACRDELAAQTGVAPATADRKWGYDEYPASQLVSVGVTVVQCYFVLWNRKTITRSVLGAKGTDVPSAF
jgi:hypothetical protein